MVTELLDCSKMLDDFSLLVLFFFLKAELDHFTYVLQRLIERFSLRIASLKKRAFDHKKAIFILLYENREL